jgi:homocysteine S-methyltransferase
MTLRYEINPPKIIQDSNLSHLEIIKLLDKVKHRVSEISNSCHGVHFTDSVLGIPRVSPVTTGVLIRKLNPKIEITVSLRVRDKSLTLLSKLMEDTVSGGLDGVLILKGDASPEEKKDSGLIPSQVVRHFNEVGYGKKLDLFLSLPSKPDFNKIQKKIEAEPAGFVTQVIHSIGEVTRIIDKLKPEGFKIIPCILLPSEKNKKSAKLLQLDWSEYKNSIEDFIRNVHNIAGEVLVTSPNDFNSAKEILGKL